ncbi:hypothetical protein QN388_25200, partial [Pseudomonas sp. 5B4]
IRRQRQMCIRDRNTRSCSAIRWIYRGTTPLHPALKRHTSGSSIPTATWCLSLIHIWDGGVWG